MTMENMPQKLVVEAIGTFALCFMGIGAIILTQGENLVAIALAHGLAIGLMVTAAGHISGGHFIPAVTTGFLVTRRISPPDAVAYIAAQLVGAVLGAGALTLVYLDLDRNAVNLGVPAVGTAEATGEGLSIGNALAMEIILTFFLVFVIFGVAVDKLTGGRAVAGLAIGLTITMDILAGADVSGAVMNPARWFGPAVVQQDFSDFWLWIVGPVVGGIVAALVYSELLIGFRPIGSQEPDPRDEAPANQDDAESGEQPQKTRRRRRRRK